MSLNGLAAKLAEEIDQEREVLVDLCNRLVAEPSMNPPGRTAGVANVVQRFLADHGVVSERIAVDEETANVIASLTGIESGRHVVFNAHMDTMQAGDETAWTVPPLVVTRKDGRLYGLGMGNLKGGLAAMALATVVLARYRDVLPGKLSFTAVCDEVMFGTRGTEHLLAVRPDLAGDFMISAEGPGFMDFAIAEKGLLWVDVEMHGSAGHSSRALRGEAAVSKLARFISETDALTDTYATLPADLEGVSGGEGNLGLRLSASAGVVDAGSVRSLIPPKVIARFDMRLPPGITIPDLKRSLEALAAKIPGTQLSYPKGWDASWEPLGSELTKTFGSVVEKIRGKAPRYVVRLPGSDARHWRDRGVPAICYGPQPTLSAGINDYANEEDVIDCAMIYAVAALRLMRRGE
jgi:succinyl-diaminopimelate desuccinylase